MLPLSSYDELCATDGSCSYTISDERLIGSGSSYRVRVVAGNVVGTGEPLNCDGQIGKCKTLGKCNLYNNIMIIMSKLVIESGGDREKERVKCIVNFNLSIHQY
jgi:hypothetical protein